MYLLVVGEGPEYPGDVVHDGGLQQLVQPLPVVPRHGQAVTRARATTTSGLGLGHCSTALFHHVSQPNQTAYHVHRQTKQHILFTFTVSLPIYLLVFLKIG